jgi:RHS repeat-associated protein
MEITDMNEAEVVSYRYDPYGAVTITVGGTPQSSDPLGNPWTYTGRFHDEETGLYYYRARYYAPEAGRFLQRDPLGYAPGVHMYQYADSCPIGYIDPMGADDLNSGNIGPPPAGVGSNSQLGADDSHATNPTEDEIKKAVDSFMPQMSPDAGPRLTRTPANPLSRPLAPLVGGSGWSWPTVGGSDAGAGFNPTSLFRSEPDDSSPPSFYPPGDPGGGETPFLPPTLPPPTAPQFPPPTQPKPKDPFWPFTAGRDPFGSGYMVGLHLGSGGTIYVSAQPGGSFPYFPPGSVGFGFDDPDAHLPIVGRCHLKVGAQVGKKNSSIGLKISKDL